MDPQPKIVFELGRSGWADLIVLADQQRHVISGISYLSDALDDLVRTGLDIALDRTFGTAAFFHEPGSTVLIAETGWWEGTTKWVEGSRLSSMPGKEYGDGEVNWTDINGAARDFTVSFASRDALAAALLAAAEEVKQKFGVCGYSDHWIGRLGFPVRGVAALRAALSIEPVLRRE